MQFATSLHLNDVSNVNRFGTVLGTHRMHYLCSVRNIFRFINYRIIYYFRDHQLSDWKGHKKQCKIIAADQAQAESHEIHKREFDRIRKKYGLDNPEKAGQIAELLANTDANEGVSAPEFAKMFGMSTEEAVVFLEWIKVSYTSQNTFNR